MHKSSYTDEEFKNAIETSYSLTQVSRKLNLSEHGNNGRTFKKKAKELGISLEHILGNKDYQKSMIKIPKTFKETFCENSCVSRSTTRKFILKDNLIPYKCTGCDLLEYKENIPYWNSKPIVLELEHINGISDDNRIENLTWLCSNCHSQTSTYAGRNNAESLLNQAQKRKDYMEGNYIIRSKKIFNYDKEELSYTGSDPIGMKRPKMFTEETQFMFRDRTCENCDEKYSPEEYSQKFCSLNCSSKGNSKFKHKITKEILEKEVWELPFTKLGVKYGVSDNAVRNWCKDLGISLPSQGYWLKAENKSG